jgi:hypothetical protein
MLQGISALFRREVPDIACWCGPSQTIFFDWGG